MSASVRWSTRRLAVLALPTIVLVISVLVVVGASDLYVRIVGLGFGLVGGYGSVQTWRAGVELSDTELVVRDEFRTHRFRWDQVRSARLERMRTRSPLAAQFPYEALAVDFVSGPSRQFEGVSAAVGETKVIETIVEEINGRIGAA